MAMKGKEEAIAMRRFYVIYLHSLLLRHTCTIPSETAEPQDDIAPGA
ncbi:unnamed protein product [Callosobruchus maculatus]|uniref:Uncharacterized protein n=1 Tax=Callosobruchus maculatus TaxID=64391 RepID=A0A653CG07_CALMS|nr:unnamed protein product [Callosobruchus maculatus]